MAKIRVTKATVRKRILEHKGIELAPVTRRPVPYSDLDRKFKKTDRMRLVELRTGQRIEDLLSRYTTIDEIAKHLDIERSTASKWRKRIREAQEE